MNWDVFISYAKEDKSFVRKIAFGLQESGLKVWFDEFSLEAGDSLLQSIDRGIRESRYGVVILSPNFFKKQWTQRELGGLISRDDGKNKVIIPIWYKVSFEDVREYSPLLADKLSIYYMGSVKGVITKILRAVYKDKASGVGWTPQFFSLQDGSDLTILPIQPIRGYAIGFGRHPITNRQYKRFVEITKHREPVGEHYIEGSWKGPFSPWKMLEFADPEKPVVCVDFRDALTYCLWAKSEETSVFIPSASLWDLVVTDMQPSLNYNAPFRMIEEYKVHHSSSCPLSVDRLGERANSLGVSDMFGNVWEWCDRIIYREPRRFPSLINTSRSRIINEAELRGGGYLDDLNVVYPILNSRMLEDGLQTRHSDLGFRIAVFIPLDYLPKDTVTLLALQPRMLSEYLIEFLHDTFHNYHYYTLRYNHDYDDSDE